MLSLTAPRSFDVFTAGLGCLVDVDSDMPSMVLTGGDHGFGYKLYLRLDGAEGSRPITAADHKKRE